MNVAHSYTVFEQRMKGLMNWYYMRGSPAERKKMNVYVLTFRNLNCGLKDQYKISEVILHHQNY